MKWKSWVQQETGIVKGFEEISSKIENWVQKRLKVTELCQRETLSLLENLSSNVGNLPMINSVPCSSAERETPYLNQICDNATEIDVTSNVIGIHGSNNKVSQLYCKRSIYHLLESINDSINSDFILLIYTIVTSVPATTTNTIFITIHYGQNDRPELKPKKLSIHWRNMITPQQDCCGGSLSSF